MVGRISKRPSSLNLGGASSNPKSSVLFAFSCFAFYFIGFWQGILFGTTETSIRIERTPTTSVIGEVITSDGWRSIQVFHGGAGVEKKIDYNDHQQEQHHPWFSQARQDEAVVALLKGKRDGYFIDLAANDAMHLSNTYSLEQFYGWNGLCIEPNPIYWYNLTRYRNCNVVAAVVGEKRMEDVYFRYDANEHGGIAGSGFDNGPRWQKKSASAHTVPLLEVLENANAPKDIDYFSLDVEGAESFIMLNFPLNQYKIKIITAERPKQELKDYLEKHGYSMIKRLTRFGETLWVHNTIMESVDVAALDAMNFPLKL